MFGDESFPDLSDLRIPQVKPANETPSKGKQRVRGRRYSGMYIQGPIPVPWITRVLALPGQKVVGLALAIWLQAGLRDSLSDLKLTSTTLKRFRINREAKRRSLEALEKAGLIEVKKSGNRNPIVSILDVEEDSPA